uniref:Cytochrome b561 domain-containing protein n=1 Tax=Alexandrium monilatum TaxID=311494 RepID=A0A7S4PT60_9DINO
MAMARRPSCPVPARGRSKILLTGALSLIFCLALPGQLTFTGTSAPRHPRTRPRAARGPAGIMAATPEAGGFLPLDVFEPAVSSYFAGSPPLFQEMKDGFKEAPFTGHWAHAIGGTLLFLYGAYAVYLGWQVRLGNGSKVYPLSYDQPAVERHPTMMGYILLFLVFEIPDGLTILAANEQPLLRSTHASTAVTCLLFMAVVGAVGTTMGANKTGRDVHTYLGSAGVLLLLAHAYFGLVLGWSF